MISGPRAGWPPVMSINANNLARNSLPLAYTTQLRLDCAGHCVGGTVRHCARLWPRLRSTTSCYCWAICCVHAGQIPSDCVIDRLVHQCYPWHLWHACFSWLEHQYLIQYPACPLYRTVPPPQLVPCWPKHSSTSHLSLALSGLQHCMASTRLCASCITSSHASCSLSLDVYSGLFHACGRYVMATNIITCFHGLAYRRESCSCCTALTGHTSLRLLVYVRPPC